ncbi:hypothetical protein Tco_0269248 [Tanacetum coccineum]
MSKNASYDNVNVPTLMVDPFLLSSLMLYGSFLLFSRIPLSLHIFSPPGMKIPFLTPAFPFDHSFMPDVSHRSGTFMKFNDCPDCDDSRARGFVLRSHEFHILSFILGIQDLCVVISHQESEVQVSDDIQERMKNKAKRSKAELENKKSVKEKQKSKPK